MAGTAGLLVADLEAEITRLRAALAMSEGPCIYCSLPRERWAECSHGFPGCSRGDDAVGCPELGARLELENLTKAVQWRPIDTAPKDGTAFLAYGIHTGSPSDAQRGVKAGDHWWAIILWDVWRTHNRWVFAKDGAPTWSEPTHWKALEPP